MTKEQKVTEFIRKIEELEREYNLIIESESLHYNVFVQDMETNQLYYWDGEKA
jgi:hypothetical protein